MPPTSWKKHNICTLISQFVLFVFGWLLGEDSMQIILYWFKGAPELRPQIDATLFVLVLSLLATAANIFFLHRSKEKEQVQIGKEFETLPPELQQYILALATRNSGNTYVALLRSSRWIHELAIGAKCTRGFAICITTDTRLHAFSRFLQDGSRSERANNIRYLLMSTKSSFTTVSRHLDIAINVVSRCSKLVSLGCSAHVLRRLLPVNCRNISSLSLSIATSDPSLGDVSRDVFSFFVNLEYLHLTPQNHVGVDVDLNVADQYMPFPLPLVRKVRHLAVDLRAIVILSADVGQLDAYGKAISESSANKLQRATYVVYSETKRLAQVFGTHGSQKPARIQSIQHAKDSTGWIDLFVRRVEDEFYVWDLPELQPVKRY